MEDKSILPESLQEAISNAESGEDKDALFADAIKILRKNIRHLSKSTDPADVRMVAQIAKLLAPTSAKVPDETGAMTAIQLPGAKDYESRNGRPYHIPTAEAVRKQITEEYSAERHPACGKTCSLLSAREQSEISEKVGGGDG